ncbi:hypothetical protein OROGR_005085 [Orobanche gracilis]
MAGSYNLITALCMVEQQLASRFKAKIYGYSPFAKWRCRDDDPVWIQKQRRLQQQSRRLQPHQESKPLFI